MGIKTVYGYIDEGYGFPVTIDEVQVLETSGSSFALIDYHRLKWMVLRELAAQPAKLTGAQVKSIRLGWGMTQEQFADEMGVKHPAVVKWEKNGQAVTAMELNTERVLRVMILRRLSALGTRLPEILSWRPTAETYTIRIVGHDVAHQSAVHADMDNRAVFSAGAACDAGSLNFNIELWSDYLEEGTVTERSGWSVSEMESDGSVTLSSETNVKTTNGSSSNEPELSVAA